MPEDRSKRMFIFAPNAEPWTDFNGMNCVWPVYSRADTSFNVEEIILCMGGV